MRVMSDDDILRDCVSNALALDDFAQRLEVPSALVPLPPRDREALELARLERVHLLKKQRTDRWRARQQAGKGEMILPILINERHIATLVAAGFLAACCTDQRDSVQAALQKMVDAAVARDDLDE